MKLRFVLLDSVEQELKAHYLREFSDRVRGTENKLEKLSRLIVGIGLDINLRYPEAAEVEKLYGEFVKRLADRTGIERVTVAPRDIAELYGMAIRHERPFKEKGSGFQDTVICLAAIDHLAASGQKVGAFVTRDGVFDAATVTELAKRKGVSLRMFENVDALFSPAFDEYIDQIANERVAEVKADWQRAKDAVEKEIPSLERFVSDQLEIQEYSFGDRVLEILNIKVLKVGDVRTPLEQKGDGAISISAELEIQLKMIVEPGILSRMAPPKKLRLGAIVEPQKNAFLFRGTDPREETTVRTVSIELKSTRVDKEYKDIEPVSLRLK
jgi:hypothetical protein